MTEAEFLAKNEELLRRQAAEKARKRGRAPENVVRFARPTQSSGQENAQQPPTLEPAMAPSAPIEDAPEIEAEPADARDPYATLVAPGKYDVAFTKAERVTVFGRSIWMLDFVIASPGAAYGLPLRAFATALSETKAPARSSTMVSIYIAATGLRPPRHLAKLNPSAFLKGKLFQALVITVKKDRNGVEVPERARYSRLKALVRVVAGATPTAHGGGMET